MTEQIRERGRAVLPQGAHEFLRHRALEAGGLVLAVTGVLLAVALASYHPDDPSWNNASSQAPANIVGFPGAYSADILLQTLGLAAALVPFLLTSWAWRLFSHEGLPRVWLKLTLVPFALLFAAGLAASFSKPAFLPLPGGLGGVLGGFLYGNTAELGERFAPQVPAFAWAILLGALALSAIAASFGLHWRDWRRIAGAPLSIVRASTSLPLRLIPNIVARASAARDQWAPVPLRAEPKLLDNGRGDPPLRERRRTAIPVRPPTPEESPRVVNKVSPKIRTSKRAKAEAEPTLNLGTDEGFQLPPLSLLQAVTGRRAQSVSNAALEQNARLLETVLGEFGVHGEIAAVHPGPVVTRYELEPAPGTKTSRVIGLADDIARSMSALSARVSVVPGQNRIGIELPNADRETVFLKELLSTPEYETTSGRLSLALGKNIAGEPVVADLARMPHLLIAGTTGSGKSVAVNTMILSLLYRLTPSQCRLIMIDPKMLELSVYDGIPHLLTPVVTEPGKAVVALKWVVREMQNRYRSMSRLGVRNVAGYNEKIAEAIASGERPKRTVQTGYDPATGEPTYEEQMLELEPMPFIVVVVDEMADLMMVAGKDVEAAIQRLSQMARAAGIHLIMATQRPSVDVITGTIKANFPTRISFQVTSKIDSRTILNEQGAEQLLGQGDMLLLEAGGRIQRVHGPFVSDQEVERVVAALKRQGSPSYLEEVTAEPEVDPDAVGAPASGGETDELYDQAVSIVLREQRASTSFVQRHLQIGYNRAARLIERMEAEGVVSGPDRVGKREVLPNGGGV